MSYQLFDDTASILILETVSGKRFWLLKSTIREMSVAREDIIRIHVGCCLCGISFRHQDVSSPVTASATALLHIIQSWITGIVVSPPNE